MTNQRLQKKRMIRGIILLVIPLIIAVSVKWFVGQMLSKSYFESAIEDSMNCEVMIGDVEVSLLSSPAVLTFSRVEIAQKYEREAVVEIQQLDLELGLWALLCRDMKVDSIRIQGAHFKNTWHEDGTHSLETLFSSAKGDAQNVIASSENRPAIQADGSATLAGPTEPTGGLNIFDQKDFIGSLGKLTIEDSTVDMTLEKTGLHIECRNVAAALDSLHIDSSNLAETDHVNLDMSGKMIITSLYGRHYGTLDIKGDTITRLFNPDTGEMEPNMEGDLMIDDQSWLDTRIPVITQAWKQLEVLEKFGIPVASLPEKSTFGRSKAINVHYHLGKLTLRQPLSIWVGDWEIAVIENSWIQSETDQHQITAELLASRSASQKFKGMTDTATSWLSEMVTQGTGNDLSQKLFKGDRLSMRVRSSGYFSSPDIEAVDGFKHVINEFKDTSEQLLNQATGVLLGKSRENK